VTALWVTSVWATPSVEIVPANWFELAELLTERNVITKAFKRIATERHTYVHIAREIPGVNQPAFDYYSFKNSAFVVSGSKYEAASTVKVMTTVGALTTLRKYGLTGNAVVRMKTGDGRFRGRVKTLYKLALAYSSNPGFNRLFMIAGYDNMVGKYVTPEAGYPRMVIKSGYGKSYFRRPLKHSPEIHYREGDKVGIIPPRVAKLSEKRCRRKNCVTLFEIEDVLRRIVLHEELQPVDRFDLAQTDVNHIRNVMRKAYCGMGRSMRRVLGGHRVHIYNKVGYVPFKNFMENSLVEDTVTGKRYLVGGTVPFDGDMKVIGRARAKLNRTLSTAMKAVLAQPETNVVTLQRNAGVQVVVDLKCNESAQPTCDIWVSSRDKAVVDSIEGWVNRDYLNLAVEDARGFHFRHQFKSTGRHGLVFRPRVGNKPVGYTALAVRVNAPKAEATTTNTR